MTNPTEPKSFTRQLISFLITPIIGLLYCMYVAWALQTISAWYLPALFGINALDYGVAMFPALLLIILWGRPFSGREKAAEILLFINCEAVYRQESNTLVLSLFMRPLWWIAIAWSAKTLWPPVAF